MDYDYLKYKKILIVDDEADLREMVTSILDQDGFKIIKTAGTVAEALKICREWEPDLAVLDIMLPDGNGFSLFEQMRTFTEVPVLFLTARGEDEDKLKGLGLGADDYITKPFDISILKARIRNLLANRKKIREALLSDNPPAQDVTYTNTLDREFMKKILALIDECMEDPEFSINNLCAKLGMSRSSLYNKLKALTDQAPNDFIRIIRLKKAAELLRSRRYNISEVAAMTGFPDSSYFSTAFKRQYGMSPRKYLSEDPG